MQKKLVFSDKISYNALAVSREIEARGHSENLPKKERLGISFCVVTISGKPGSGSTVLAKGLAEKYGVKLIPIGQMHREVIEEPNAPII
ncbi:MAG: hypothetical protein QXF25_00520, partial [Candidatus Pacearchaeota archaeon]